LVHCVRHLDVATALDTFRRGWLQVLFTPARHSHAGLRRRATAIAIAQAWTPRPA
jgi:hypothetical protein